MKASSIVLLIIGVLLLLMQFAGYIGNDFQFPAFYRGEDFITTLSINSSNIIGYNIFGLLGIVLIKMAITRKSNLK
jgi:hypothetical protein